MTTNGVGHHATAAKQLVWFITGTSSGFGARLVRAAIDKGDRVIATARSLDGLSEALLKHGIKPPSSSTSTESTNLGNVDEQLRTLQLDVTSGKESIKAIVDEAASFWGRIDVVVNNAGYGVPSLLEEGGSEVCRRQFEANVFGLLDVTTAALPHLRATKGILVNIGSRSAWKTELPGIGYYCASKAAVHAISETLAVELAQFGIKVLVVAPGTFRTEGIYRYKYATSNLIPEYDPLREASMKRFNSISGNEKGDPEKAMKILVDVVRGEGVAEGRPLPPLLILGEDAVGDARYRCNKTLSVAAEWEEVSSSTNFD